MGRRGMGWATGSGAVASRLSISRGGRRALLAWGEAPLGERRSRDAPRSWEERGAARSASGTFEGAPPAGQRRPTLHFASACGETGEGVDEFRRGRTYVERCTATRPREILPERAGEH